MHALVGAHIDTPNRSLILAPPRIPVKAPVFGRLYYGQVDFTQSADNLQLRLANRADEPSVIRTLTIKLPEGTAPGMCSVQRGKVSEIHSRKSGETVLTDVVIPPKGELSLQWNRKSTGFPGPSNNGNNSFR
jgi:hypothetical protein